MVGSLIPLALNASSAHAAPSAPVAAGDVLVLLADQHSALPMNKGLNSARTRANRSSQKDVVARARAAGATAVHSFGIINAFSAHLSDDQAAQLAADPRVRAIVPDRPITRPARLRSGAPSSTGVTSPTPTSGTCPSDPAKPLLEPEALQVTHTAYLDSGRPQAQSIATGKGVKVAFIADGIDIDNSDFIRSDGSHVFVDYQDFTGEGVAAPSDAIEAFTDASAIGAQGRTSYDLADFVNPVHPLPQGCTITVRGVAPGASLVALKVYGQQPNTTTSRFIEAIEYAVTSGVDVLNESFTTNAYPDNSDDPFTLADNAAIAAGVAVVTITGDAGTMGTVGSPASSSEGVIAVAASTTLRAYQQTSSAGAQLSNGHWISNNISALSSGGTTQSNRVPDLVAPGDLGWGVCSPDVDVYQSCYGFDGEPSNLQLFGGTSQSGPFTAGAAALVIEAYASSHGGAKPSPALVKRFLTSTATDLGHPADEQGAGLLNSLAAVKAARSWHDSHGSPARSGKGLVVNRTQLSLEGDSGRTRTAKLKVTNTSAAVQQVAASTRSFEDVVKAEVGTAPLDTASATSYADAFGIARSYVSRTFVVGDADRLDVSMAQPSAPAAGRIVLIDPTGAYAAYSSPQGTANYAHVDVRYPKAGTWTAYFALSKSSGFAGTVQYRVRQTNASTHGTVTPRSTTLKPGQTKTFRVRTPLPSAPGDLSTAVELASSSGVTTSVPLTLRSLIPSGNATFTGTLTGGNGRAYSPAQANFYDIAVPKGKRDLSLGVTFPDGPEVVSGYLSAPDGQVYAFDRNALDHNALQLHLLRPTAGRWHFALRVDNPATGRSTEATFVGRVAYDSVQVSAALPAIPSKRLTRGVAVTVPVHIRNDGVAPATYFVDARLRSSGTLPLVELSGHPTFALPQPADAAPAWLVPTHVSRATFGARASEPVNLDAFFQSFEPDRYAHATGGTVTNLRVDAAQVSPGIWNADVGQQGPFAGPAAAGTVTVAATVRARLFDPAVSAPCGDPWRAGVVGSSGDADGTGLTLRPGQSGTLDVTITPDGKRGTRVEGDLFVDTFDRELGQGDELAAIPYAYTIK